MPEPEIMNARESRPYQRRSWLSAYGAFLRSPQEHRVAKLIPLALMGIVPLSILDDLLIPVYGVIDDLPTSILAIVVVIYTAKRVNKYR